MKHLHRYVALERRGLAAACLLRPPRIGNGVAAGFTQSSKAVGPVTAFAMLIGGSRSKRTLPSKPKLQDTRQWQHCYPSMSNESTVDADECSCASALQLCDRSSSRRPASRRRHGNVPDPCRISVRSAKASPNHHRLPKFFYPNL